MEDKKNTTFDIKMNKHNTLGIEYTKQTLLATGMRSKYTNDNDMTTTVEVDKVEIRVTIFRSELRK